MSDLATKQYVIDMIGRYVGQFSGGGGTVPDDPAGIIKTCKDYTDEQIILANQYADGITATARTEAEQAAKDYTDDEIKACNKYAENQAKAAMETAQGAAKKYTDDEIKACNKYAENQAKAAMETAQGAAKKYTDDEIKAANKYAEDQAAAAMGEANRTILSYVRARFTELDYEFRDVAITNAWQGIYYADVDRPAVLANKHIISTMIVQTYGGSPMGAYLKSPADTSQIRFTSPVSKTMHITVRFVLLNKDDEETT